MSDFVYILIELISVLRIKENGFTFKKKSRQYPAEIITDADYADDPALLANTPAPAESLLHSLKQTAGGIGERK